MKFFTLISAALLCLYAANALMLRTVIKHAAVLDAREQMEQTLGAVFAWKEGIKDGVDGSREQPLDLAVFAKPGLITKAHTENTPNSKDKTFIVDMEVEGTKFSLADIHMDGNGPDDKPGEAGKTIKQFLIDEGLTKEKLSGLDAVAGDSNITPHKVSKKIAGLNANADLSILIAKALSEISSEGSHTWCVYMANTQVGKRRVGFSLMNNQIFKSEPQAGGAELDGTFLAVKNNNPAVTFEGDKFRKGCWNKGNKNDPGKPKDVASATKSDAFKFETDPDVPTGSIFLDHAALKFKIKNTVFYVVNVGAVIDVSYKTWVDGDAWLATLKNGIKTAKALDQELYKGVKDALKAATGLEQPVVDSIKLVFNPEKAEDFWGKGDKPTGVTDNGAMFEKSALYKAADTQQNIILEVLKKATNSFLQSVDEKKATYYKDGQTPKMDLKAQQAAVTKKFEKAKSKKPADKPKSMWKAIGEGLGDAGLKQPFGGFGNDIGNLLPKETKMLSVEAIYGRLKKLVDQGGVVVASEVSGPNFEATSKGVKKDVVKEAGKQGANGPGDQVAGKDAVKGLAVQVKGALQDKVNKEVQAGKDAVKGLAVQVKGALQGKVNKAVQVNGALQGKEAGKDAVKGLAVQVKGALQDKVNKAVQVNGALQGKEAGKDAVKGLAVQVKGP